MICSSSSSGSNTYSSSWGYSQSVSIITTCKGRWEHFADALRPSAFWATRLPSELGLSEPSTQFIVVAYDSLPKGLVAPFRVVQVETDGSPFNPCRANNIGAEFAAGDILVFIPCDMTFRHVKILNLDDNTDLIANSLVTTDIPHVQVYDKIICIRRWLHELIRGWNEYIFDEYNGWGYDAEDYCHRACMVEANHSFQNLQADFVHTPHSDNVRSNNYTEKDLWSSYENHCALSKWWRKNIGMQGNIGPKWGSRSCCVRSVSGPL